MLNAIEVWRPTTFTGRYEVSNLGRVRRTTTQHILIPNRDSSGYPRVTLTPTPTSRISKRIHAIVAGAFIGERPKGKQVNHIDGNKWNNNVGNLEYVTNKENIRHAYRLGLRWPVDWRHKKTKLTPEIASSVRYLTSNALVPTMALSVRFGVHQQTILAIANGEIWKSIPSIAEPSALSLAVLNAWLREPKPSRKHLTRDQVGMAKQLLSAHSVTETATRLGVSPNRIYKLRLGTSWR